MGCRSRVRAEGIGWTSGDGDGDGGQRPWEEMVEM